MIDNVHITNFRRFRTLAMLGCTRINILVGDNGAGKTAVLEAIFLALAQNPQKAVLIRQTRGLEGSFAGEPRAIEEALYGEIFYEMNPANTVEIRLTGSGPECRSLRIARGPGDIRIPTGSSPTDFEIVSPITFEWTSAEGEKFLTRTKISPSGIEFESTGEDLAQFFFYQSQAPVPSGETAARFSTLSKRGEAEGIIRAMQDIFEWIDWLGIEVIGGAPALHASVRGGRTRVPVTAVSGAVTRIVAILIAIAQRKHGLVLVDEIENGIYHARQSPAAHAILSAARKNECQLFLSTHSLEWLRALTDAAGNEVDDITLWRIEDTAADTVGLFKFSGETLKAGIEYGAEVRGEGPPRATSTKDRKP